MHTFIKEFFKVITMLAVVLAVQALAFSEPSQEPPEGNVPAPLNVGSEGQSKRGGLLLNSGGATYGLLVEKGRVGIGILDPAQKLDVGGFIRGADGLCIRNDCRTQWPAAEGIPSGAVMFFNKSSCPSGWSELTDARGRYLVGTPSGGSVGARVGEALSDRENRPTGKHNHNIRGIESGAPAQEPPLYVPGNFDRNYTWRDNLSQPTGDVEGTNAPYLQLLTCQKN